MRAEHNSTETFGYMYHSAIAPNEHYVIDLRNFTKMKIVVKLNDV